MEVILLKNVENLGSLGDKVSVKGGYGRNFLIPTGSAVPATAANQAAFEERRAELEQKSRRVSGSKAGSYASQRSLNNGKRSSPVRLSRIFKIHVKWLMTEAMISILS